MLDYKEQIQAIFEEMVDREFGCNYWDLSEDEQYELYKKATKEYTERVADQADYFRKAEREAL